MAPSEPHPRYRGRLPGQPPKFVPPVAAHWPPHHGLAATAATGPAGGVTVTVLPGGTVTVVPLGPGVMTVGGEALGAGAGAGTMTVPV